MTTHSVENSAPTRRAGPAAGGDEQTLFVLGAGGDLTARLPLRRDDTPLRKYRAGSAGPGNSLLRADA